jgi:molybdenum cofactor cytidylyltransferase
MVQNACTQPRIGAVILAAGESKRMGRPKQLLPIGGQPMLRRVSESVCASGLAQVIVVIGAAAERVEEAISGLPLAVVRNPLWSEGMSTSLRAGIGALEAGIRAAIVVLADHPNVTPGLLNRLMECYVRTGAAAVVPTYQGRRGHPVLFDRRLFPDLLRIEGDRGAGSLLDRAGTEVVYLQVDDAAVVQDVDDLDDYAALQNGGQNPC